MISADLPQGARYYQSMAERLCVMLRPKTMPSEMEVFAMSKMLKKPIVVVGDTFHTIVKCGVEDFAEESPDSVMYTVRVKDVGHYDSVVVSEEDGRT